jgi:hypothetical protein
VSFAAVSKLQVLVTVISYSCQFQLSVIAVTVVRYRCKLLLSVTAVSCTNLLQPFSSLSYKKILRPLLQKRFTVLKLKALYIRGRTVIQCPGLLYKTFYSLKYCPGANIICVASPIIVRGFSYFHDRVILVRHKALSRTTVNLICNLWL